MRSVRNILAGLLLATSLAGCVYGPGYGHRYGGYAYGGGGYYGGGYHPRHYDYDRW
jgi:hypothetical protein